MYKLYSKSIIRNKKQEDQHSNLFDINKGALLDINKGVVVVSTLKVIQSKCIKLCSKPINR